MKSTWNKRLSIIIAVLMVLQMVGQISAPFVNNYAYGQELSALEEGEQATESPSAENADEAQQEQDEIVIDEYAYSKSKEAIIGYNGSATELVIPGTLNLDGNEYPVKRIGDHAFVGTQLEKKLTSVTLSEGIEEVGTSSFAGNQLNQLIIPVTLKKIGNNSFGYNLLEDFLIPEESKLDTIGEAAFQNNNIETVNFTSATLLNEIGNLAFAQNKINSITFNENLTAIGEKAFEENKLSEVVLTENINSIGYGAFAKNGRYVYLTGNAPGGKTDVIPGEFGSIYKPVSIWIKGIDKDSGKEIVSPRLLENNPFEESPKERLLFENNEASLTAPVINGYLAENANITLSEENLDTYIENNPYVFKYENNVGKDPEITGLEFLDIPLMGDGSITALMRGVTATDSRGNNITSDIKVSPNMVDTSVAGQHQVKYTVTDSSGNTTVRVRIVSVAIDPMELETGKGWQMKDFRYSGNTVIGLSNSGLEKLKDNKEIVLPSFNPASTNKMPITTVGQNAFSNKGLISVVIPDTVKTIEYDAFKNNQLTEISLNNVTTIKEYAFGYNQLTSVDIPEGVSAIKAGAFSNNNLTKVSLPSTLTRIENRVFENNKLTSVDLPESIQSIGSHAFKDNQIVQISFNDKIATIGDHAFYNNKLENLSIPETITTIGDYAFSKNSLEEIIIPENVINLGTYVFSDNNIKDIVLPDNMEVIPNGTFNNNKITEFKWPSKIREIGNGAFNNNWLKSLDFPETVVRIGNNAFQSNPTLKDIKLNEGLEVIGNYAFYNTGFITDELRTPSTLKSIGEYAFADGSMGHMVIKNLVLNQGLEYMGPRAFSNIYLENVTIPDTLTTLETAVFYGNKLTSVVIPENITDIKNSAFSNNRLTDVTLPETLVNIGSHAFYENHNISNIKIPESVRRIDQYAFSKNRIESLKLPSQLETLGTAAFESNKIYSIEIPETIINLNNSVFKDNNITNVKLPSNLNSIGSSTFENNRIGTIDFPDTLTSIGASAFRNNAIANLELPDSVTEIGSSAFENNHISTLKLSENLEVVKSGAFRNNNLTTLTIPENIREIHSGAFSTNNIDRVEVSENGKLTTVADFAFFSNNIKEMSLPNTITSIGPNAFASNPGWDEKPGKVRVSTPSTSINSQGTYVVNEGVLIIYKKLEGTDEEVGFPEKKFAKIGTSVTFTPISNVKYTPVSPAPIIEEITSETKEVTVYYKPKETFNNRGVTIDLKHAVNGRADTYQPYNLKKANISSYHEFIINITGSGNTERIDNPWVEIDLNGNFPGGHIDVDKFVWPNNIKELATEYKIEDGIIKIKLKNPITPNYAIEIPFKMSFKNYETPINYTLDLTGKTAIVQDGTKLYTSSLDNNIGITGYVGTPYLYKQSEYYIYGSMGDDGYLVEGSERPVRYTFSISHLSRHIDNVTFKDTLPTYIGKDFATGEERNDLIAKFDPDLNPDWKLGQDGRTVTYVGKGTLQSSSSAGSVDFRPLYLSYPGIKNKTRVVNNVEGTFTFKNREGTLTGNNDTEIKNKFKGEETVYEEEPVVVRAANVSHTAQLQPIVQPSRTPDVTYSFSGGVYKRNTDFYGSTNNRVLNNRDKELVENGIKTQTDRNSRSNITYNFKGKSYTGYHYLEREYYNSHYTNYFRDVKEDRSQEFAWGIKMTITNSSAKNLVLYEYNLDPRMKYTAVLIPKEIPSAKIKFYNVKVEDDKDYSANLIHEDIVFGDKYILPENVSEEAKSFVLEFDGEIENNIGRSVNLVGAVYTKLRNPEESAFTAEGANVYGHSEANKFRNTVKFNYTAFNEKHQQSLSYKNTEQIGVLPFESSAGFSKVIPNKKVTYGTNEKIDFDLNFTSNKQNGEVYSDFKLVDVLPPKVTPNDVVLSKNFKKNAVNPQVEYIENFIPESGPGKKDSQWAIVITADSYDPTPESPQNTSGGLVTYNGKIATVKVTTNAEIDSNEYINKAYLSAHGGGTFNLNEPTSKNGIDARTKALYNDYTNVLKGQDSFHVLLGNEVKGYKYVKSDTDKTWSSYSKLKSQQNYEYKLLVSNKTSVDVPGFQLIDIFPYNDDLRTVVNDDGVFNSRGTYLKATTMEGEKVEDRVRMNGPIRFETEEDARNFKALYATEDSSTYKGVPLATISDRDIWKEAGEITDWTKVTALKIIATDSRGLRGNMNYNFFVPMKAPVNPDYLYDDLPSINTFALRTSPLSNFVEGNEVKVILYSDRYTINIKKFGIDESNVENGVVTPKRTPLAGAKFKVWAEAVEGYDSEDEIIQKGEYRVLKDPMRGDFTDEEEPIFITTEDGTVEVPQLKGNRNYILEEIEAPAGYKIGRRQNGKFIDTTFTRITKEQLKSSEDNKRTFDVEIDNTKKFVITPIVPLTGKIKFYKFNTSGKPLPFTGFEITGGPNGNYKTRAWSTTTGLVEFNNLPLFGENYPYTIKEIAPRGVLQPIEPLVVKLTNTGDGKNPVEVNLGIIKNDKAELNVGKLGIFNPKEATKPLEKLKKTSGKRLEGVRLELQEEDGTVVQGLSTNGRGEVTFKNLEINHDYYVAEPNPPEGFLPYTDASTNNRIKVSVDEKGIIRINDNISAQSYIIVPNTPKDFTNIIDILKMGDDDTFLPGAKFGLYEIAEDGRSVLLEEKTTDDNGRLEFRDFGIERSPTGNTVLLEKTFEVRELESPIGYVNKTKPVRFTTSGESITYQSFEFVNPKIIIEVYKKDHATKKTLRGAEFTLHEGVSGKGDVLETVITDGEGKATFTYQGFDSKKSYSIRETVAPKGYSISTNPVQIIDLPGLINRDNFKGKASYTFLNKEQNGRILVTKTDNVRRLPLENVEFTLVDKTEGNGKEADIVLRTNSEGIVRFTGLSIGKTYYLSETTPLPGYKADENQDIPVTVSEDGYVVKNLTNEHLPGKIKIQKVDEHNRKLENVQFTIERRLPGGTYVGARTATTDAEGLAEFNNLKVGYEYRLRETSVTNATPSVYGGYKLSKDTWRILVEHDDANPTVAKVLVYKNSGTSVVESSPLTIVNERANVDKVKVNVEKTFKGGEHYDGLSGLKVALYRWDGVNENTKEKVGDDKELVVDDTSKTLKMKASFTNLDYDYYDQTTATYKKWTYYVEEVMPASLNGIYEAKVTETTADADSLTREFSIKNTYTSPKIANLEATKVWENGDAANRPTVWFKLYRKIASDNDYSPVAGADIKQLPNGTTTVSWTNLDQTDSDGYAYTYKVKEVNEDGDDLIPENYRKSETGLTVTNSYVIPHTKSVAAKKVWVNGDPNNRPDAWFTLYRQVEGGNPEVVIKEDGSKETKKIPTTTDSEITVNWTGLARTDINGKVYTYTVKETDADGADLQLTNYNKSTSNDGLTITNTYVIPKDKEVKASKIWINGDANNRPDVWFKLYRQVGENGPKEDANADVKKVVKNGDGTYSAQWTGLDRTNSAGAEYIYTVKEVNEQGKDYTPTNYKKTEDGLTVTNKFVSPKDVTVTGTKQWENGPAAKPTVWFKLYRQVGADGEKEAVPTSEAPLKELSGDTRTVTWENLTRYNLEGQEYIFSIDEVDAEGNVHTPTDYAKTVVNATTIKNTYVIPKKGTATGTKVWVNGDEENRPTIWLKLYRQVEGGQVEAVPTSEAPVMALENGAPNATWNNLSQTDIDGNVYTFSVKEVDANGKDFKPDNFDKVEKDLQVTNTYVIPKTATAKGVKIWVNGDADNRPTVWFKLYRNVPGGDPEEVPEDEAPIKKLENGTTEVTWNNLSKTDSAARVYTFTVREVNENGKPFVPTNYEKVESELGVTNTYVIPKNGSATATKSWVNGSTRKMEIQFKLYRHIEGGAEEEVPVAEAPVKTLPVGITEVTWNNLSETDINGKPYTFVVHELNEEGNPTNFVNNFRVTENGLDVTNTYEAPKSVKIDAKKLWVDGNENNRPDVWLRVYRNIDGGNVEAVPTDEAPVKKVTKSQTPEGETVYSASWTNLTKTDIEGRDYIFTVKEVNKDGNDFTPENYTKFEKGLTVTNTYVSPTDAVAKATKVWENGPENKPTVWFKLYRKVAGGELEEVPVKEAPIKKLENGTTEVTWKNLTKTDKTENVYIFEVKEVDANGKDYKPENYEKIENGLTVTNSYVPPRVEKLDATKTWVDGDENNRPDVWFKLYRNIEGGNVEEVPVAEAPVIKVSKSQDYDSGYGVTWNDLTATDINGNYYTFTVKEVDENGDDFTPVNYVKTEKDLNVTNKYVSPKDAVAKATKVWVKGPKDHPDTWFKLYRNVEGGKVIEVPEDEAPIKKLENGTTEVTWENLTKTDKVERPYIFTIKEVNEDGEEFSPENYVKEEDGLTVTNKYVSPKDAVAKATKVWEHGPKDKPEIWFKLYRNIEDGEVEAVPEDEAPIKKLENGTTEVTWENLTKTDEDGNVYTFTVKEVNEDGEDFTPENYEKVEEDLTITNSYVIPMTEKVTATKVWINAKNHPTIWFKLYRSIEGGKVEEVPVNEAPIKKLENGTNKVTWENLSATDIDGNPYIYSVKEVDQSGSDYTPEGFTKKEDGLTVTNTKKPEVPNTGDNSGVTEYAGLMLLALLSMIVTIKRKSENADR